MPRKRLTTRLLSYGIYDGWDGSHIPQIREFTDVVPARPGIEFGYVLHVDGGRGETLDFRIDHPPFRDDKGRLAPSFTGEIHVKTGQYDVFLGDSIWEPWADKCGLWTLTLHHGEDLLAEKTFTIVPPDSLHDADH